MSTTEAKRPLVAAIQDAEAFKSLFPPESYERWEIAGSVRRRKGEVSDIEHVIIPRNGQVPGTGLFAEPETVNLLWHRTEELLAGRDVDKHVYKSERGASWRWGERYRGMDFRGFNHEIFIADADNWGSVLAIRTGPQELSKELVIGLQRYGYCNRGGYVRTLSRWRCECGYECEEPDWVPMSSAEYHKRGTDNTGPQCPRCRAAGGPEPVIVPCQEEQAFFRMAGLPFQPPEYRGVRS